MPVDLTRSKPEDNLEDRSSRCEGTRFDRKADEPVDNTGRLLERSGLLLAPEHNDQGRGDTQVAEGGTDEPDGDLRGEGRKVGKGDVVERDADAVPERDDDLREHGL